MDAEELRQTRARFELEQAERRFRLDPAERRMIRWAILAAIAIHTAVLAVEMPSLAGAPERVEPPQQLMQIRFLKPPPPAPPQAPPAPPEPEKKRIPRPDPEPDKPEPVAPAPPPEPAPEPVALEGAGPVRVEPGQGPGLIKKVEPEYPYVARVAHIEGKVVLDAVITKEGTVSDIKVLSASHPVLARAAATALTKWLFTPSDHAVIMTLTVTFVLHE